MARSWPSCGASAIISKLYVKDLETGQLSKVYDALDQDQQETWAVNGLYPSMEWMPDSKSIVFWAGGKIRRVDMSGQSAVIPFRVNDTRVVIDPPQPKIDVAPDTFRTKMPRFVSVSPDNKRVVFESLGKLYVKHAARWRAGAPDADATARRWSCSRRGRVTGRRWSMSSGRMPAWAASARWRRTDRAAR